MYRVTKKKFVIFVFSALFLSVWNYAWATTNTKDVFVDKILVSGSSVDNKKANGSPEPLFLNDYCFFARAFFNQSYEVCEKNKSADANEGYEKNNNVFSHALRLETQNINIVQPTNIPEMADPKRDEQYQRLLANEDVFALADYPQDSNSSNDINNHNDSLIKPDGKNVMLEKPSANSVQLQVPTINKPAANLIISKVADAQIDPKADVQISAITETISSSVVSSQEVNDKRASDSSSAGALSSVPCPVPLPTFENWSTTTESNSVSEYQQYRAQCIANFPLPNPSCSPLLTATQWLNGGGEYTHHAQYANYLNACRLPPLACSLPPLDEKAWQTQGGDRSPESHAQYTQRCTPEPVACTSPLATAAQWQAADGPYTTDQTYANYRNRCLSDNEQPNLSCSPYLSQSAWLNAGGQYTQQGEYSVYVDACRLPPLACSLPPLDEKAWQTQGGDRSPESHAQYTQRCTPEPVACTSPLATAAQWQAADGPYTTDQTYANYRNRCVNDNAQPNLSCNPYLSQSAWLNAGGQYTQQGEYSVYVDACRLPPLACSLPPLDEKAWQTQGGDRSPESHAQYTQRCTPEPVACTSPLATAAQWQAADGPYTTDQTYANYRNRCVNDNAQPNLSCNPYLSQSAWLNAGGQYTQQGEYSVYVDACRLPPLACSLPPLDEKAWQTQGGDRSPESHAQYTQRCTPEPVACTSPLATAAQWQAADGPYTTDQTYANYRNRCVNDNAQSNLSCSPYLSQSAWLNAGGQYTQQGEYSVYVDACRLPPLACSLPPLDEKAWQTQGGDRSPESHAQYTQRCTPEPVACTSPLPTAAQWQAADGPYTSDQTYTNYRNRCVNDNAQPNLSCSPYLSQPEWLNAGGQYTQHGEYSVYVESCQVDNLSCSLPVLSQSQWRQEGGERSSETYGDYYTRCTPEPVACTSPLATAAQWQAADGPYTTDQTYANYRNRCVNDNAQPNLSCSPYLSQSAWLNAGGQYTQQGEYSVYVESCQVDNLSCSLPVLSQSQWRQEGGERSSETYGDYYTRCTPEPVACTSPLATAAQWQAADGPYTTDQTYANYRNRCLNENTKPNLVCTIPLLNNNQWYQYGGEYTQENYSQYETRCQSTVHFDPLICSKPVMSEYVWRVRGGGNTGESYQGYFDRCTTENSENEVPLECDSRLYINQYKWEQAGGLATTETHEEYQDRCFYSMDGYNPNPRSFACSTPSYTQFQYQQLVINSELANFENYAEHIRRCNGGGDHTDNEDTDENPLVTCVPGHKSYPAWVNAGGIESEEKYFDYVSRCQYFDDETSTMMCSSPVLDDRQWRASVGNDHHERYSDYYFRCLAECSLE